jgi:hypothetical protein
MVEMSPPAMISWMPGCVSKRVHPGHPVFHSSEFIRPSCAKPLSSSTGPNLVSLAWASTRRAQPLPNPLRAGPLNNQRRVLVLRRAIIQPISLNIIKDFTIVDEPLVPSRQKPSSFIHFAFLSYTYLQSRKCISLVSSCLSDLQGFVTTLAHFVRFFASKDLMSNPASGLK